MRQRSTSRERHIGGWNDERKRYLKNGAHVLYSLERGREGGNSKNILRRITASGKKNLDKNVSKLSSHRLYGIKKRAQNKPQFRSMAIPNSVREDKENRFLE